MQGVAKVSWRQRFGPRASPPANGASRALALALQAKLAATRAAAALVANGFMILAPLEAARNR